MASERSERDIYKFELVRCIYIYIYVWRYVCHNSSACHAYVMWAELGHCHFYTCQQFLTVVTAGNGTGTKNVLKWNRALGFEGSIQSSAYSQPGHSPVSFLLYVSVEIDPFSCEQTSAI